MCSGVNSSVFLTVAWFNCDAAGFFSDIYALHLLADADDVLTNVDFYFFVTW